MSNNTANGDAAAQQAQAGREARRFAASPHEAAVQWAVDTSKHEQEMGKPTKRKAMAASSGGPSPRRVSDADHAVLDADWHKSFDALNAAGLEAHADHPIAAQYRDASDAVNHANRSRDFDIASGGSAQFRSNPPSQLEHDRLRYKN